MASARLPRPRRSSRSGAGSRRGSRRARPSSSTRARRRWPRRSRWRPSPGLTVITNSCRLAERMARAGSDAAIHLLGGRFGADNAQTTGGAVIEQIALFRADRAILTVAAIDPAQGAMDASLDEAQIARAMMSQCKKRHGACRCNEVRSPRRLCGLRHRGHRAISSPTHRLDKAHKEALIDRGVNLWI